VPHASTGAAIAGFDEPVRRGEDQRRDRPVSLDSASSVRSRPPARPQSGGVSSAWVRSVDWLLVGSAVAMSVLGSLLIYSATQGKLAHQGLDPQTFLKRHLVNLLIGLALAFLIQRFDYRLLRAYTPILYLASIVGLVVVLSPIGKTINGSHAWILLPAGFSIEPAEFAKVAIILGMAMLLSEKHDSSTEPRDADVGLAILVALVPMGLVLLQPNVGTMLMIVTPMLAVIAVAGVKGRWLVAILGAGGLATFAVVELHLIKTYQVQRFTAFVQPALNQQSFGYNTTQARIAIGSGGLFGKGLFHGPETQGRFVPENQTDFVFSVLGEELGFIGAITLVVLLGIFLWRAITIATKAQDLFGRLVATGIACWIAFQAFENIGMNLGIMPVTGVPLPFVSYGGSSMFAAWIAVGLLLNVHMRSQE